jgi:hypothetical protein
MARMCGRPTISADRFQSGDGSPGVVGIAQAKPMPLRPIKQRISHLLILRRRYLELLHQLIRHSCRQFLHFCNNIFSFYMLPQYSAAD